MDAGRRLEGSKDMFDTGRRSAISTSELGLYSDHSEYYNTSTYGATVRKIVIGIMVVVSVALIGVFLYDFASSASISSKNQDTKHIYILQNSLRKPINITRRSGVTLAPTIYIVNSSRATVFEDRSDDVNNPEYKINADESSRGLESRSQRMAIDEPELRNQNLKNFKLRKRLLDRQESEDDIATVQDKQMVDNHAMIYRVSSRLKLPESDETGSDNNGEETKRATPFRFELKGPPPASFKRPKYPQLTQYRYPHNSRNIQDIIKYLTSDPETLNRGIKFTGFYVNPKKYDTPHTDIGEVAMNSDRSEEQEAAPYAIAFNADPLYQYKPKHPSDVNLLATSNFRFSPIGMQRYHPYYDMLYQRPNSNKHAAHQDHQHDSAGAYGTSFGKKRKPKPFSVMLDIYPITDGVDHIKKTSRLKSQYALDDSESRRPVIPMYMRHQALYGLHTQPMHSIPASNHHPGGSEEEEKHQMILHLNVYPKRKSKLTREDVIDRSEVMPAHEKKQLIDRIIAPFDAITKHLADHAAVEEAKYHENEEVMDTSKVRYEETPLAKEESMTTTSTEEIKAEKLIGTTMINDCNRDCEILTIAPETTTFTTPTVVVNDTSAAITHSAELDQAPIEHAKSTTTKDIDTIEGFQEFADSLIAMD